MTISLPEIGVQCLDFVTDVSGMVIKNYIIGVEPENVLVISVFQPHGVNRKTARPLKSIKIDPYRLRPLHWVQIDMPMDILGTEATDMSSGLKGTIVAIAQMPEKRVSVLIQPKGVRDEDWEVAPGIEVDIARCSGPVLDELRIARQVAEQ
jgi:hypothetical protein